MRGAGNSQPQADPWRLAVAPMMDWTDRDCRYFLRLLSPDIRLYTEMVTARAVLHGPADRLLAFDPFERPLALQLGGSVPVELEKATRLALSVHPYDEVNLNVGCPSDRVQSGRFGACLMAEPGLVADCFRAMAGATDRPVSIKTRIGIDEHDDYDFLANFVATVAAAGCRLFVVHARKAILRGLSPKENRSIPPLHYERVWRLKASFPELHIVVNGGIDSEQAVSEQLASVDGVMIGRKAYNDPYWLTRLQLAHLGGYPGKPPSREDVVRAMAGYARQRLAQGGRLTNIVRHMLGLYASQPGAARWRRFLVESARGADAGPEVLLESLVLRERAA